MQITPSNPSEGDTPSSPYYEYVHELVDYLAQETESKNLAENKVRDFADLLAAYPVVPLLIQLPYDEPFALEFLLRIHKANIEKEQESTESATFFETNKRAILTAGNMLEFAKDEVSKLKSAKWMTQADFLTEQYKFLLFDFIAHEQDQIAAKILGVEEVDSEADWYNLFYYTALPNIVQSLRLLLLIQK